MRFLVVDDSHADREFLRYNIEQRERREGEDRHEIDSSAESLTHA